MTRFLKGVREEIDQAVDFYDAKRPGLADDFLKVLNENFAEIEAHPLRNPCLGLRGIRSDYHFLLLSRFPYQIVYRVRVDGIDVIAIAHTSRRPGYWKKRQD